jgi:tRNA A37 methylthiotransferase MiaB
VLFEDSFNFVAGLGFSGLHVFRYSKRPGTPAARFRDQVAEESIVERARRMRELDHRLRTAFAAGALGSRRRVLLEEGGPVPEGLTDHFLRVRFAEPRGQGPWQKYREQYGPSTEVETSLPISGLLWARVVSTEGPLAIAQKA